MGELMGYPLSPRWLPTVRNCPCTACFPFPVPDFVQLLLFPFQFPFFCFSLGFALLCERALFLATLPALLCLFCLSALPLAPKNRKQKWNITKMIRFTFCNFFRSVLSLM